MVDTRYRKRDFFFTFFFFLSSTFHAGTKEYRPNISEKKRQENKSSQKINKVQNDDENATEKTKSAYEEIWFLFEQQPFMWKCVWLFLCEWIYMWIVWPMNDAYFSSIDVMLMLKTMAQIKRSQVTSNKNRREIKDENEEERVSESERETAKKIISTIVQRDGKK